MILHSQFTPASGLSNAHLQTLLPILLRKNLKFKGVKQRLELDDGDFLDLVWTEKPANNAAQKNKPIVIVFHGLEGSIHSPYAKGMMLAIKARGWIGLLMHFRGCSEFDNRLARTYHSGETADAKQLLNWLKKHYANANLAAVGFSLGGNMLLKLQAELAEASPFNAVVSVCAPLQLDACATRLNSGFSKIYQMYLLFYLKQKLRTKSTQHDYKKLINFDVNNVHKIKNFWTFDDKVTAPLHGFLGADDYYKQCSSRQYLKNIKNPSLILLALDDPFMLPEIIPEEAELSATTQLELSLTGGHVGFINGTVLKPKYWLEERVPEFLSEFI
ncbi:Putative esterase YheT functionally coupled to phosphoribulokinase homolog [hydrothermal vent metagenome]|uniref:Esterase YheT functionally coupled to phosphoribulokinase homolog n=1 Tax=hydrothermal vent metagenome TaxID=652676 RepID=A0A3B0XJX1_9ZZZZ